MNEQKLKIAISEFTKKKKSNAAYYKENWDERQERKAFYQSYTKDKILAMTEDEFLEYISKLWSMLIWGNKKYVVDKLIADGKIVVMTTQVMYEGSDMEVYEVGHVAKERYGLIESYDMTLEATVTKLMWIMAQTKDPQRIKAMFYTTINHDILFQ